MSQDREIQRKIRAAKGSPTPQARPKGRQAPSPSWPTQIGDREQRALLAASSEGMIVLDADGVVTDANQKAASMLGLADRDIGHSVRDVLVRFLLVGRDGAPLPVEGWPGFRALRGETIRNLDVGIHWEGRTNWLSTSAVPISPAGGACRGAVVTLSDVTMLRALEVHHEQLIRVVSHDIRNPLTSVHLNAQLLQKILAERGLEREEGLVATVLTAARRLDAMIEELVDSSRVRSGQLRLELRQVALERAVPEILARNASTLDTTRIRLALPDGPVRVTADVARLERVVTSLLIIALRNCADGAEVALRVAVVGDEVRFAVVVPGRAHSSEEPPVQPSRHLSHKTDHGYGLGFFIARMLVERHGGRLWVEGAPDRAVTLHFALPVGGPETGASVART